uniref:serine/threonine-protein kinase PCRK1-like n=1 Tax=Erigeron canadensis TaxID=72917 RepID=UPI001CB9B325|nr:serine/threonine-protein kinase PCRK1-like [Erigeron canadensis]
MVFPFNFIYFDSKPTETEIKPVLSPADQSYHSAQADLAPTLSNDEDLLIFPCNELIDATGNFSPSSKIGEGELGSLYETDISIEYPDTILQVMVKRLNQKGHKEWVKAKDIHGVVEHPNLVTLVGYSDEVNESERLCLLVYERMANKSVEYHLSTRSQTPLPWTIRLKVAQDTACGLAHLHEKMIPFGVFKSSNIFLNNQWKAKLSYFGLVYNEEPTNISTMMAGNMGYVAPECFQTGCHSPDCDTWGYGVFLYELITGRRPVEMNRPQNEQKLLEWVKPHVDSNRLEPIIDPRLEDNYSLDSVHKLCIIANRCLACNRKLRPKMSEVLEMINKLIGVPSKTSCPTPPLKSLVPVVYYHTQESFQVQCIHS